MWEHELLQTWCAHIHTHGSPGRPRAFPLELAMCNLQGSILSSPSVYPHAIDRRRTSVYAPAIYVYTCDDVSRFAYCLIAYLYYCNLGFPTCNLLYTHIMTSLCIHVQSLTCILSLLKVRLFPLAAGAACSQGVRGRCLPFMESWSNRPLWTHGGLVGRCASEPA